MGKQYKKAEKLHKLLTAPTLLVDLQKVSRNIARMKAKADASGCQLQPHFKTHQSLAIGAQFTRQGITAATVSSLSMANYFALGGWKQLHIAMPVLCFQRDEAQTIAQKCSLSCNVSRLEHLTALKGLSIAGVYIDIDTGYGRTGIKAQNTQAIRDLLQAIDSAGIPFKGLYCHNGASYGLESKEMLVANYSQSLRQLKDVQTHFDRPSELMIGDTPGCSATPTFKGVDRVSAGNYVFYDLMQYQLGSCTLDDIAVCMACPILEKNIDLQTVVVHGGAVHFSKETLEMDGNMVFGKSVALNYDEWETGFNGALISISQEHGTVQLDSNSFQKAQIGDFIGILPIHSCLTADAMGAYLSTEGVLVSSL